MVDAERLGRVLARVLADVTALRELGGEPGLQTDAVRLAAVKYRFVTAIEGCVRAAHHVVASEGLGTPESNADAVRLLGRHGAVEENLSTSIARAAGFRNVLVHQYADVDDNAVVANLGLVDELEAYAASLAAWANDRSEPPS